MADRPSSAQIWAALTDRSWETPAPTKATTGPTFLPCGHTELQHSGGLSCAKINDIEASIAATQRREARSWRERRRARKEKS